MESVPAFELKRYDSLESLMSRHWGVPESDWAEVTFGQVTTEGKELPEEPGLEVIKRTKAAGFWGFADTKAGVIHFWLDEDAARDGDLLEFFAHEIAHLTLHQGKDSVEDQLACEREAGIIGLIARSAGDTLRNLRATAHAEVR